MSRLQSAVLLLILLLLVSLSANVSAEPHPHKGKVTPFKAGDPGVKLNGKALKILSSGKPFQTQIQSGSSGGRGLVVQDVDAPTEIVWERILDFDSYNRMVPKTAESKIYKTEQVGRGQKRIMVRMKVGFPMLKFQFYVNHFYDPKKRSMTWTLDYTKKSDFDDSCGYWYIEPNPNNPNHSRVFYSVEVSMFPWVPQFVMDFMSKQALTDATAWVKKYSEIEYAKQGGGGGTKSVPAKKHHWWNRSKRAADDPSTTSELWNDKPNTPVRITRVALVSTVLALLFYNLHLYFSQ